VRSPAEFAAVHVLGARNVPLERLNRDALPDVPNTKEGTIYVICQSGARGAKACDILMSLGCSNVMNVQGGTRACEEAGLAVVRGKAIISLERQVRIIAGGMACVGAILALTIDPLFALIPAGIGGGLVYAGVTDTCGMGMMLARMPWNQRGSTCSGGAEKI
jgi:rhodanese-related sulfurtransferase